MRELDRLQEALGCTFSDRALLRLALTHPSVAHEQGIRLQHNQRLEFLGDSVLGLVLTHELYQRFPELDEGALTQARAGLVNRRSLAGRARSLDLGRYIVLSRGEESNGGRERVSILADSFEAVVGACYLDAGLDAARALILRLFEPDLASGPAREDSGNPKGELQEQLQATATQPPSYRVEAIAGPDHDREFECAVYHEDVELGRGRGKSKQEAEIRAAQDALRKRAGNPPGPVAGV